MACCCRYIMQSVEVMNNVFHDSTSELRVDVSSQHTWLRRTQTKNQLVTGAVPSTQGPV